MTPGEDMSPLQAPWARAAQDTAVLKGHPQGHRAADHSQALRRVELRLPALLASPVNQAICTDTGFRHRS